MVPGWGGWGGRVRWALSDQEAEIRQSRLNWLELTDVYAGL